ncbi:hypothetical protein RIR_jg24295.t1 [Rhizophagus irregularis DAOM 181602=DAOM 197198]|nr:hypothetical protein RIR_jg24295.t1 [Rhizophagus irregularis DAOM 181602=DAOM 197198]
MKLSVELMNSIATNVIISKGKIIKSIHHKEDNPLLFLLHHEHRQKNTFASIDPKVDAARYWQLSVPHRVDKILGRSRGFRS